MPPTHWLATGGSYYVLAFVWIGSAVFFAIIAMSAGKAVRSENDGCLVAIGNVVLAFFGGGLGFLVLMNYFPYFLLSSMAGAIAFPALATNAFIRRARKG